jgi:hypothetical protein
MSAEEWILAVPIGLSKPAPRAEKPLTYSRSVQLVNTAVSLISSVHYLT